MVLEARINYKSGRNYTIEANNIETLKNKCQEFIDNPQVVDIWVVRIEGVGWLKNDLAPELLQLRYGEGK